MTIISSLRVFWKQFCLKSKSTTVLYALQVRSIVFESVGVGVSSKNLGKKLKKETILLYFHSFHFKFNMLSKKCACVCSGLGEERPGQLLDNSLFYMKINDKCLLREKVGKAAPPLPFRCYVPALADRRSTRLIVIVLMTIWSTISIGSFMLP